MILEQGSKVLVTHRRLFEYDRSRYFFGTVEAYESGIVKLKGNTWIQDPKTTALFKKEEVRTKILSLASGAFIFYELDDVLQLEFLRFYSTPEGRFYFTDDRGFEIDVSEVLYLENLDKSA